MCVVPPHVLFPTLLTSSLVTLFSVLLLVLLLVPGPSSFLLLELALAPSILALFHFLRNSSVLLPSPLIDSENSPPLHITSRFGSLMVIMFSPFHAPVFLPSASASRSILSSTSFLLVVLLITGSSILLLELVSISLLAVPTRSRLRFALFSLRVPSIFHLPHIVMSRCM